MACVFYVVSKWMWIKLISGGGKCISAPERTSWPASIIALFKIYLFNIFFAALHTSYFPQNFNAFYIYIWMQFDCERYKMLYFDSFCLEGFGKLLFKQIKSGFEVEPDGLNLSVFRLFLLLLLQLLLLKCV